MLEVLSKTICFLIMAITGFYVIKAITGSKVRLKDSRSILYLLFLVSIQVVFYQVQYTISYTLLVFLSNIITYKAIFKINLEDSIISCGIFTVILFFSDILVTIVLRILYTFNELRTDPLISILANLETSLLSIIVVSVKPIINKIRKFYDNNKTKKTIASIIFITMLITVLCYLGYYITSYASYDSSYIISATIIVLLSIITYIFIKNRNSYNQLSDEYDSLFSYIQNFEDWIEKEQLNRHEYKNQLAVLRCLTTEKNVKDKIDGILEDNINIEGEVVHKLKELPKGGLKGLMYYKVAIAQKNKIKITVDVSLELKSILNKLSEENMKVLCKLIGIYFDNAIEAAVETKKKIILLEIYELTDKVNIVISNTFNKSKNFDKRNEKGVTTKGEGRGNGLYFASNLVSKNNWLLAKQETIDNYYIQTLTIKKLD